jgi:hypothetical protein
VFLICSARNLKTMKRQLKNKNTATSFIFLPIPISIFILITQKYSDIKLRLFGHQYPRRIIFKCLVKELWLDIRFRTPYSLMFFNLYLIYIRSEQRRAKEYLELFSQKEIKELIFSRSSLCDLRIDDINFNKNAMSRIQNEGTGTAPHTIKNMVESKILVWRVGKSHINLLPIDAKRFMEDYSNLCSISKNMNHDPKIQLIKVINGTVSGGHYAALNAEIIPTSSYFQSELSPSIPFFTPYVDVNGSIRTMISRNDVEFESGIFAGFHPNYYHFTWEIFPRFLDFYQHAPSKGVPIILSRHSPNAIIEMAKTISTVQPILIGDDQRAIIKSLNVVYDGRYPSQVDFRDQSNSNIFERRKEDLNKMREFVANHDWPNLKPGHKRIFIARPEFDNRVPKNSKEIHEFLQVNQFTKIAPEGMSFGEQVSTFRDAEQICIMAGAAVTNLVYCQNLKKLVILCAVDYSREVMWNFWRDYCLFLGLQATFLYTDKTNEEFGSIDIRDLKKALIQ